MLESHCNRSKLKAALSLPLKPRYSSAGTLPAALIKPFAITVPTHLHNSPFQMKGLVSDLHQHDPTRGRDIKCLKRVFEVVYLLQHEAATQGTRKMRAWDPGDFQLLFTAGAKFQKELYLTWGTPSSTLERFPFAKLEAHYKFFRQGCPSNTRLALQREQGVEEHPVPATASPSSTQSCSVVPSSHEQRKWGRIFFFSQKK